jgi:hypothetical protein
MMLLHGLVSVTVRPCNVTPRRQDYADSMPDDLSEEILPQSAFSKAHKVRFYRLAAIRQVEIVIVALLYTIVVVAPSDFSDQIKSYSSDSLAVGSVLYVLLYGGIFGRVAALIVLTSATVFFLFRYFLLWSDSLELLPSGINYRHVCWHLFVPWAQITEYRPGESLTGIPSELKRNTICFRVAAVTETALVITLRGREFLTELDALVADRLQTQAVSEPNADARP